jgi:outer membrane protein assembly factor BamB
MHCKIRFACYFLAVCLSVLPAHAITIEQIISREHPHFNAANARLTVGRDGMVYLSSAQGDYGYVMRIARDGSQKFGGDTVYAVQNATANAQGVMATANAHFAGKVAIYDRDYKVTGESTDFLNENRFNSPAHVEAGQTDFYGLDQNRNRIVRISPNGKVVKVYSYTRESEGDQGNVEDFRVDEARQVFFLNDRNGKIWAVGFDGQKKWLISANVQGGYNSGGFDVDDAGNLYTLHATGAPFKKYGPDGKEIGDIKFPAPDQSVPYEQRHIAGLRIVGGEAIVKRRNATELFERYDLATGVLKQVAESEHERLAMTYPNEVWTTGEAVPLKIDFDAAGGAVKPRWRVWLRPMDFLDYQELKIEDGKVTLPQNIGGGIYQIKVTSEVSPWQRGVAPEYLVRSWIELRAPGSKGTLNAMTPKNRAFYGRGEEIPFSILARTAASTPVSATVKLIEGADVAGTKILTQWKASATPGTSSQLAVPAALTAALRPGNYTLVASAAGFTSVPQRLSIGPGENRSSFLVMQYGDYGPTFPSDTSVSNPRVSVWDFPDAVAAHLDYTSKLDWNLYVDRIGTDLLKGAISDATLRGDVETLRKRLESDPLAVAPEKVLPAPSFVQTVAGYGARGVDQMAILFNMDVGLPLNGSGFDNRKPEQFLADLTNVTNALKPYPAFRGWSYAANWWIYDDPRRKAWTAEEKAAYDAAWKAMKETGKWSEVLEREQNIRYGYAAQGVDLLNATLKKIAPELVTATAPSVRNVDAYPPITLQDVDEADLQAQFEQIAIPYYAPESVDFYKRPGKRAWGHPEIHNDAGTGDQILPTLWQMAMRGANGIGMSGRVPPWGVLPNDPRIAYAGMASIYRANNEMFQQYGPWLETLQNDDEVAIIGSRRQFMTDEWSGITGRHFARVLEAYTACLGAHHPASIVFVDDLKPDTLKKYKAILLVGQTIEMEPQLIAALQSAKAASVKIFYDGSSRESLVKEYSPLGVAFDKFEKDPHAASDDHAYWRFVEYNRINVPFVQKALDGVATPVARIGNTEVTASRRKAESGEYIFVVNNAPISLEPGEMWRIALSVTSRLPLQIPVGINVPKGSAVYDAFALQRATPQNGSINADFRSFPARLYAVLPATIDRVALRGPSTLTAGEAFDWSAQVLDATAKPIKASIPLRLRLLGANGAVLEERFLAVGSKGATGRMRLALNTTGSTLAMEATELFSGKTARASLTAKAATLPLATGTLPGVKPVAAASVGKTTAATIAPALEKFGAHLRDVALLDGGKTAVFNAMNWDRNLFAIDTTTGKPQWQRKVGQYFSFSPQALQNGIAVQGFDFKTAEGYHLHLLDAKGETQRRFALYGVPRRAMFRFVPGMMKDQINSFATPESGSWVASAGDLGLAVWSRDGKLLWSQDWWKTNRNFAWMQGVTNHGLAEKRTPQIAALDARTLIVADDRKATAYAATDGKQLWQITLAPTGQTRKIVLAPDHKTFALLTTTESGRTYIVRDGKVVRTLSGVADEADFAPDGESLVIAAANYLKLFSIKDGLQWTLPADNTLRFPRFAPDGKRVAASSDMGVLYVVGVDGNVRLERDMKALAVPAWLPNGDLLLGTWMGRVIRLDSNYKPLWSTLLRPAVANAEEALIRAETAPTSRIANWGNAEKEAAPITPNLLAETQSIIRWITPNASHIQLQGDMAKLYDGKPDAPREPWLQWRYISDMAEGYGTNWLQMDTVRSKVRATGITIVEDPAHPESWWRDCYVEYWDTEKEQWVFIQTLLSDSATHTHKFARPVEATRFRLVPTWGVVGNMRFGEVVLHGEVLGPSHPDAFAKNPALTLFDENADLNEYLIWAGNGLEPKFEGAYSGSRFYALRGDSHAVPYPWPVIGSAIPSWDFEIAENPGPGQYRYLQWAWKALSPETRGLTFEVDNTFALHAGENGAHPSRTPIKLADAPPREWKTERVDLWELFKRPARFHGFSFHTVGGAGGFDQIVLGRTPADLPPEKK